jgi:hypothetical protein
MPTPQKAWRLPTDQAGPASILEAYLSSSQARLHVGRLGTPDVVASCDSFGGKREQGADGSQGKAFQYLSGAAAYGVGENKVDVL